MVQKFVYNANLKRAGYDGTRNEEPRRSVRYKIIAVLLFLIISICLSIFPLSRAIDNQINSISATTELKHLTDKLVLVIIEQTEVERTFFLSRSHESEQKFGNLSNEITEILQSLENATQSNEKWRNWYMAVNFAVIERDEYLKNLMAIARTLPQDAKPSLNPTIEDNIRSNKVIKLILTFVEQEELLLTSSYERLNVLRSILSYVAIFAILLSLFLTFFINSKLRHNIKQLKSYRDQLAEENSWLEYHVQERTMELEIAIKHAQKERERVEYLLQDASHRIGNSLATASSLLSIQINQSKNEEVQNALTLARDHIQTLATAHRRLRLSEDMDTADTKDFFETIIKDIALSLPPQKHTKIIIKNHIQSYKINARDATTLAIIIGELITNAVKHAFSPNMEGIIEVLLVEDGDGTLSLTVEDNGRGFPPDMSSARGLGNLIISKLSVQFDTKPIFESKVDGGARTIIRLKNLKLVSDKGMC